MRVVHVHLYWRPEVDIGPGGPGGYLSSSSSVVSNLESKIEGDIAGGRVFVRSASPETSDVVRQGAWLRFMARMQSNGRQPSVTPAPRLGLRPVAVPRIIPVPCCHIILLSHIRFHLLTHTVRTFAEEGRLIRPSLPSPLSSCLLLILLF